MKVYQGIRKGIFKISDWIFTVCIFMVVALMLLVAMEVVLRYVFNSPTNWTGEINGYLYIMIVLLGVGYVQRSGSHIKMDFFYGKTKGRARIFVDFFINHIILIYSIVVTYQGWGYALKSLLRDERSSTTLAFPLWPSMMAVPIGFGVMALVSLCMVIDGIIAWKNYGKDDAGKTTEA